MSCDGAGVASGVGVGVGVGDGAGVAAGIGVGSTAIAAAFSWKEGSSLGSGSSAFLRGISLVNGVSCVTPPQP